jgi:hypothetical protein
MVRPSALAERAESEGDEYRECPRYHLVTCTVPRASNLMTEVSKAASSRG